MSSFLAEVQMEYEQNTGNYEYHLPHTKTIDLIGEEFAPRGGGSKNSSGQSTSGAASATIVTSMADLVSLLPVRRGFS